MEISLNQWRSIISLLIIVIAIAFYFFGENVYDRNIRLLMEENFQGEIIHKYIDYDNHAYSIIVLKNSEEIALSSNLDRIVEIGDSISKTKNDSLYWVYKKSDTIIYNGAQDIKK